MDVEAGEEKEILMTRFYSVVTFHSVSQPDTREAAKERERERKRGADEETQLQEKKRMRQRTSRISHWVNQQTKLSSLSSGLREIV